MKQVETELKFDLALDAPVPELPAELVLGPGDAQVLRAVYLDTTDLVLLRHRITLRRREGGPDEGWHLKLPRPDGSRWEVHAPLTTGLGTWRIPAELREEARSQLVEALAASVAEDAASRADDDMVAPGDGSDSAPDPAQNPLVGVEFLPVAVLTTQRREIDLLDEHGRVFARLCDDSVTALPEGQHWRELEVELASDSSAGPEEKGLLAQIVQTFQAQGVGLSAAPSKLSRALGVRVERADLGLGPDPSGPAREVIHAYLAAQVGAILSREADVRADAPDAVHKMRVGTRRLRSALRTFRRMVKPDLTDPLRAEVKWLADMLGGPRDAEVTQARLLAQIDLLPEHLLRGPARERITSELAAEHDRAHAALVDALDSPRYAALVDALVDLVADPPWRGRAHQRADIVLPVLVAEAIARAERERALADAATGAEREHLLHETRKRAKAVRYAAEALAPTFGQDATSLAITWEQVTETLGQVQDCAVAAARIAELEALAQQAGESDYTYGVLAGMERATGALAQVEAEAALAATDDSLRALPVMTPRPAEIPPAAAD